MVNRSKGKALEPSTKRLESPEKETLPDARNRYAALLKAIDQLTIGPLQTTGYSFAFYTRQLSGAFSPQMRVLPRRRSRTLNPFIGFTPGDSKSSLTSTSNIRVGVTPRAGGVVDHIEAAKQEAKVDDAGQQIQFEKDRPNSQYLFARLEARAIQA